MAGHPEEDEVARLALRLVKLACKGSPPAVRACNAAARAMGYLSAVLSQPGREDAAFAALCRAAREVHDRQTAKRHATVPDLASAAPQGRA